MSCKRTREPSGPGMVTAAGMVVKAQRRPVNPAVLEKERHSTATSSAPGISKMLCGTSLSVSLMKAS